MTLTLTDPADPPPLPEALLIVRAGQGYALFDAAEAADTHPNDLAVSAALSVHATADSLRLAIEEWHRAAAAARGGRVHA